MNDSWVQARGLAKHFGSFVAVEGLDLTLHKGEVLGFLGPNGAGKTTTMRMLTGFMHPTAGSVSIQGIELALEPLKAKARIGYLPEGAPLYGDMTPRQLLKFVGKARSMARGLLRERMDVVVRQMELQEVLDQSIDTLSKGFKRRVGIAQAILHNPPILILDEPTDGLDPIQKREVRSLIKTMAKEKAIIISTHILEEVEAVCTRAMILADGKMVTDTTPLALIEQSYAHGSLRLLLRGAMSELVREKLLKLSSVRDAERLNCDEKHCEFILYPSASAVDITEVSQMAHIEQWKIEAMETQRGNLDEVFIALASHPVQRP